MSKLDKEKVLSEFSQAYKAANGKAPSIEESPGWYSVDGSKNMRLAKLAEWTEELTSGASTSASAEKPKAKAKKAVEKKTTPKATLKVTKKATGGLSAKEQWQHYLASQIGASKPPRGF